MAFHPAVETWFRQSFGSPTPAQSAGWPPIARGDVFVVPEIAIRTGDTPSSERARFTRSPTDILITTPESLYLMLASRARHALASVTTVVVDEIHALAPTKRGAHLALSLERLEALTGRRLQRIGKENGFEVVSLGPAMQRLADESGAYLHGFSNTRMGVGHWNSAGHLAAAAIVADHFCADSGGASVPPLAIRP